GIDAQWPRSTLHNFGTDHNLLNPLEARQLEHGVKQDRLHDGTQAPGSGLTIDGLAGDRFQGVLGDVETDVLHLEQPLILLNESVLRNGEDLHQRRLVKILKRGNYRQSPDELRD